MDAYSVEAGAMRIFGDVCELVGRISAVQESDDGEGAGVPCGLRDLLEAHKTLMGDAPGSGVLRDGEARILRDERVAYVPPLAYRVLTLMEDLMIWFGETAAHPVIASCVFHYWLLCLHPFEDGNGRLARLWQSRLIESWRPGAGALDLESAVGERKDAYLDALAASDQSKDAGPFLLFMLCVLKDELEKTLKRCPQACACPDDAAAARPPQRADLSEPVERLLGAFGGKALTGAALMKNLGMSHRGTFRKNYLDPALEASLVEMTQPDSPRSPTQKYRLTADGMAALA